ncbi:hypothetical protein LTR62_001568 [Meristemomyces frigidus]|uniref:Uncharacterized protein n=1 Tax=Meristemomyces frigidus TaxID=1508187 RepID=A0AAN7YIA3_9PEZI|nr:hypothetical protein LTR62_001568 [Meristemomyces frigidus]
MKEALDASRAKREQAMQRMKERRWKKEWESLKERARLQNQAQQQQKQPRDQQPHINADMINRKKRKQLQATVEGAPEAPHGDAPAPIWMPPPGVIIPVKNIDGIPFQEEEDDVADTPIDGEKSQSLAVASPEISERDGPSVYNGSHGNTAAGKVDDTRLRPPPISIPQATCLADDTNTSSPFRYFLTSPSLPTQKPIPEYRVTKCFFDVALVKIDDIRDRDTRTKTAFWIHRALTTTPDSYVGLNNVVACYQASFQDTTGHTTLPRDDFVLMVEQLFRTKDVTFVQHGWTGLSFRPRTLSHDQSPEETACEESVQAGHVSVVYLTRIPIQQQRHWGKLDPSEAYDFDDHQPVFDTVDYDHTLHYTKKLWSLEEPLRSKIWLDMIFTKGANEEIDERSLLALYEDVFREAPHGRLCADALIGLIEKRYPSVDRVEVAPETVVIYGLRTREHLMDPDTHPYFRRQRRRENREKLETDERQQTVDKLLEMEAQGHFTLRDIGPQASLNLYQEYMLHNPLLSLPVSQPSPWMQRLRASNRGEHVSGDQPGFPGHKVENLDRIIVRRYEKRKMEEAKKGSGEGCCEAEWGGAGFSQVTHARY